MIRRWCPTCRGWQDFRQLKPDEKAAVREEKGPRHFVDNLWRCTAPGCLFYQTHLHARGGGILPDRFREEAAAATEPE